MKKISITVAAVFLIFFAPSVHAADKVILDAPFTVQAPGGKWAEEPWANACEEAVLTMVNAYYIGHKLDEEIAIQQLQQIFAYKKRFGIISRDESAGLMVSVAQGMYSWRPRVVRDVTVDQIKNEIDRKHPVIVPFDVRWLEERPYEGVVKYHTVVVVGYDDNTGEFVVNDPGTVKGERLRMKYDELLRANERYQIGDTREQRGRDVVFTEPFFDLGDWMRRMMSGAIAGFWG